MGAPQRIFTRRQLLEIAFEGADTPGAVDTYVHYLRRKLGRGIVQTVHGIGYRSGSDDAEGDPKSSVAPVGSQRSRRRSR